MTTDLDWDRRVAELWASFDQLGEADFVAAMGDLVAERPADDAAAAYEMASAHDSTGGTDLAVPLYRRALDIGLDEGLRRQAVIQLASSLRALGDAQGSATLLRAELDATSDELDDAVRAFLALALADLGREREAVAVALTALAGHLPRYRRSVTNYARELEAPAKET